MALFSWFNSSTINRQPRQPSLQRTSVNYAMWPTAQVRDSLEASKKASVLPQSPTSILREPVKVTFSIVSEN